MAAKRTRLTAAVVLAAAVVIASVVAVAGGSGGDGRLAWKGKVQIFDSGVPTDRILYAQVENTSLEDMELEADDVTAYDEDGRKVQSSMRFLAAFAHGIYGWSQRGEAGEFERRRLGQIVSLKPGQVAPVTLSWRVPEGRKQPVRADFGAADLPIPPR